MEYKVSELADKAGVTKRTIHYYISKGLLLPPEGSGVNSLYNEYLYLHHHAIPDCRLHQFSILY